MIEYGKTAHKCSTSTGREEIFGVPGTSRKQTLALLFTFDTSSRGTNQNANSRR